MNALKMITRCAEHGEPISASPTGVPTAEEIQWLAERELTQERLAEPEHRE